MQPHVFQPYDVRERQSAVVNFFLIVPGGITLEQATSQTAWANAWKLFENRKYSMIDMIADDGAWEATLRIMTSVNGVVKFRTIRYWEPEAKPGRKPNEPEGYRFEHVPQKGWRAVAADNSIVADGEPQREDAIKAALAHKVKA